MKALTHFGGSLVEDTLFFCGLKGNTTMKTLADSGGRHTHECAQHGYRAHHVLSASGQGHLSAKPTRRMGAETIRDAPMFHVAAQRVLT